MDSYYRRDLALVHHHGFGTHADACAPGILRLLDSLRRGRALVVELGCGSGRLTGISSNRRYTVLTFSK